MRADALWGALGVQMTAGCEDWSALGGLRLLFYWLPARNWRLCDVFDCASARIAE